jgi:phosphoglucomutase
LGAEMDERFLQKVVSVSLSPDVIQRQNDLKIVYTPIHGTGVKLIPMALAKMGFKNVIHIPEQDVVSGDFPTVISPNPEEPAALALAIKKAAEVDADLVMASDPDADRLGIAIKNDKGEFILVNGNQTVLIFLYYIITKRKELGLLTGNEYIVKTIVTSELAAEMAKRNGVEYFDVYTGFKYIAEVIRENQGVKTYIGGGEESFGFLPADFVRDKDAVSSCALMAEIAAWAKDNSRSLFEMLLEIYMTYGYSKEKLKSVVRKGKSGAEEIEQMMVNFRNNPPKHLAGSEISVIKDYETLIERNLITGEEMPINQKITANVLQFFTLDGSKVSVRPSGTEPKIKFYIEVKGKLDSPDKYDETENKTNQKIDQVMVDLGL